MADDLRMALTDLLRKAEMDGDADFLREGVRVLGQALMELEVTQHLGAERHERTPERPGQRNGYRTRQWDTRVGTIELKVPRVRDGTLLPEHARAAEAGGAGPGGGGAGGLRPGGLHAEGGRPGAGPGDGRDQQEPGLAALPGTGRGGGAVPEPAPGGCVPVRLAGRDLPEGAGERAGGVDGGGDRHRGHGDGRAGGPGAGRGTQRGRGVLDASSCGVWWPGACAGVQLVISDAHEGLEGGDRRGALGGELAEVPSPLHAQRPLARAQGGGAMVAATIRTVFVQPDAASAREQWRRVADSFRARYPRLAELLDEAEDDVLAYPAFPTSTGGRSGRTTRWSG